MSAIHQVTAGATVRDAISNHLFASQQLFRSWGHRSEIYAETIDPFVADRVRQVQDLRRTVDPDDILILHYSIRSAAFDIAAEVPARLAMHYHNITPSKFLWDQSPLLALMCGSGRERLADYADVVRASCADSRYNAAELEDAGYRDPSVVGILGPEPERRPRGPRPDGPLRLLFVGRLVPNKAQHDLILALAALHEIGVPAVLRLVGHWGVTAPYHAICSRLARELGVAQAVEFLGSVSDEELRAEYALADVFVCLSEHEGYCVPAVEAMESGLPIVAYAAGAVPDTVGAAGLVLSDKRPSTVAEAIVEVTSNTALQQRFAEARAEQLRDLGPAAVGARLRAFVEELGGAG